MYDYTNGMLVKLMLGAASDPAQNPYWKRDVRRAYPRLSVVTQEGFAELLQIKGSEGKAYVHFLLSPLPS
jgi:hypothetical protein